MLTHQEVKILHHCQEIEIDNHDIATIISFFRKKTKQQKNKFIEEITRMNDLMEVLHLLAKV